MNTAVIIYLLLLLGGAVFTGTGIYILFGIGWMFLTLAVLAFGFAAFLRKGMVNENISTDTE